MRASSFLPFFRRVECRFDSIDLDFSFDPNGKFNLIDGRMNYG